MPSLQEKLRNALAALLAVCALAACVPGSMDDTTAKAGSGDNAIEISPGGSDAAVGRAADGHFMVAWWEFHQGVFARCFDAAGHALGDAFMVDAGPADYSARSGAPVLAADTQGRYILAWSGTHNAWMQRFDAGCAPVGAKTLVDPIGAPMSIVAASGGGFVMALRHGRDIYIPNGFGSSNLASAISITLRRYDADAVAQGPDIAVAQALASDFLPVSVTLGAPTLATNQAGEIAVAWGRIEQTGINALSGYDLSGSAWFRLYSPDGSALTDAQPATGTTKWGGIDAITGTERVSIALTREGQPLVVWRGYDPDTVSVSGYRIFRRLFAADGSATATEQVLPSLGINPSAPVLALNPDGSATMVNTVFIGHDDVGQGMMEMQTFAVDGQPMSAPHTVAPAGTPSLATDAGGNLVLVTSPQVRAFFPAR